MKTPCIVSRDCDRYEDLEGKMQEAEAYLDKKAEEFKEEILSGWSVKIGRTEYDFDHVVERAFDHDGLNCSMRRMIGLNLEERTQGLAEVKAVLEDALNNLCDELAQKSLNQ